MKVILDSTEIVHDPSLTGVHFRLLAEFLRHENAELIVPGVVIKESGRRIQAEWRRLAEAVLRERREPLTPRSISALVQAAHNVVDDAETQRIAQGLAERVKEYGARIYGDPVVSHSALVDALLASRKPFKDDGHGYRDALVWCTVVEVARQDAHVVLISHNTKDFPKAQDGSMHPDLVRWFGEAAVDPNAVQLYHSLQQFADEVIVPTYPEAQDKVRIIDRNHNVVDIDRAVDQVMPRISGLVNESVLFPDGLDPGWHLEGLKLADWGIGVHDVRRLPDGRLVVTGQIALTAEAVAEPSERRDGTLVNPTAAPGWIAAYLRAAIAVVLAPDSGDVLDYEVGELELEDMDVR